LRAAKKMSGDFCGVGNARKRNSFGESRRGRHNGGRLRKGTERSRNARERGEKKWEKSHSELCAKSLEKRKWRQKKKMRRARREPHHKIWALNEKVS